MGLHRGRFISLVLAVALGGGVVACDSDSSEDEVAQAEETVEEAEESEVEVDVEALPFYATGPVAKVNGEEIGADAFNAMVKERTERLPGQLPPQMIEMFKTQTLDFIVDKHLVDKVLEGEDIEVTDEDVDDAFAEFRQRFPDDEVFEGYLAQLGMTAEEVRESMQQDVELEKFLATRYDLEITEEAANAFYEENREQFSHDDEVHARHILLKVDQQADEAAAVAVKERADAIYAQATADGADFEELARQNSEGPTGPRGGDLGFFAKANMVPEFSEAAFSMQPGDVSEPVRTQFGYHIIQVVDKRDAATSDFDEVKDDIFVQLRHQQRAEVFQKFIDELKAEATVEKFAQNIEVNQPAGGHQHPPQGMPQGMPPQGAPPQGGAAPSGGEQQQRQLKLDPSLQQ